MKNRTLFFGDNLKILREKFPSDEGYFDLIYLDPPFNSQATYNVLFKEGVVDSEAQVAAFEDTWHWNVDAQAQFTELVTDPSYPQKVSDAMHGMEKVLGHNDVLAYLTMMAVRLVELQRVLKSTGSLYLHCDPTASHYLKVVFDAIFGPQRFEAEIIWKRYGAHNDSKGYGAVHDVILFYSKTGQVTFNKQHVAYDAAYVEERFRFRDPDGRRWAEQNLASPNPRPNLTYPFKAKNGITYDPPPNGWKYTPDRLRELDDADRLHYPAKPGGRLRLKNYMDELPGVPVQDVWTDLPPIGGTSPERLAIRPKNLRRFSNESSAPAPTKAIGFSIHLEAAERPLRRRKNSVGSGW